MTRRYLPLPVAWSRPPPDDSPEAGAGEADPEDREDFPVDLDYDPFARPPALGDPVGAEDVDADADVTFMGENDNYAVPDLVADRAPVARGLTGAQGPQVPRIARGASVMGAFTPPRWQTARALVPDPGHDSVITARLGLLRASRVGADLDFTVSRPPTATELLGVSPAAARVIFCSPRVEAMARISSPVEEADRSKAEKARKTNANSQWHSGAVDLLQLDVFTAWQVIFSENPNVGLFGYQLGLAANWHIADPEDFANEGAFFTNRKEGARLFTLLETSYRNCCRVAPHGALSPALIAQVKTNIINFFRLRAGSLLPWTTPPPTTPHAAGVAIIARSIVAQHHAVRRCFDYALQAIAETCLTQPGDSQVENAALMIMVRPFYEAYLRNGMSNQLSQNAVKISLAHVPPIFLAAAHGSTAAAWAGIVGLGPASTITASQTPPTTTGATPPATDPPPPAYVPPTGLAPGGSGNTGGSGGGQARGGGCWANGGGGGSNTNGGGRNWPGHTTEVRFNDGFSRGNPRSRRSSPPPGQAHEPLAIPSSSDIIGSISPHGRSVFRCLVCNLTGHRPYECPKAFFSAFGKVMPGQRGDGSQDPTAWLNGELVPAARADLAEYLRWTRVPVNRRCPITATIIAAGP